LSDKGTFTGKLCDERAFKQLKLFFFVGELHFSAVKIYGFQHCLEEKYLIKIIPIT
jgi:hypothetical protein